ncbi:MAG TPA: hypothetical protein VMT69_05955 [Kineosporiaceae bacterium]|nr:hypothetical protein [Kineosporiaceae bacterium]
MASGAVGKARSGPPEAVGKAGGELGPAPGEAGRAAAPGVLTRRAERLLRSPTRVRRGVLWLFATGAGYAAVIAVLAWGGDRPGSFAPWLRIPDETYFWWEAVFIGPVIVAGGLLAATVVYLLARTAGGGGGFDDTLALTGPAVAFGTAFTLVPDLVVGLLLVTHVLDVEAWMTGITTASLTLALVWAYQLAYVAAFLVAFALVVRTAHGLPRRWAALVGLTGFVLYQGFLFVFIR